MTDSTTQIIRRQRHLKTTIAGWLFPLSFALRYIPALKEFAEVVEAFAGLLLGTAAADAGRDKIRGIVSVVKESMHRMPCALLASILAVGGVSVGVCGCSSFRSFQTETSPDGTIRETDVRARTFWDSKSDLAKLRASTTDKTQGLTIGALGQESTATNVVSLVESVVRAAVGAAVKP